MAYGDRLSAEVEAIATDIVDAAYRVHLALGPGLLESAYEACLAAELASRRRKVIRQHCVPIVYGNLRLDEGFRIDLLVDNCVIIEVKAVETMNPIFAQQVKTYLRLTGIELGILINFNVPILKDGVKRIICTQ